MGKQLPGARSYAFLIFKEEVSVQLLISKCFPKDGSYFTVIKSMAVPEKIVQVRPWRLSDSDYMPLPYKFLNPRNTVR
jgi:cytoplasmic polyadenylation element-binding protein